MKTRVFKKKAKSIFTRSKLPGTKWVINPYVGCQHACLYCYAKFMGRWRPDSYGEWGKWVEAKMNAPSLAGEKYVKGSVYMSSVCDPYQKVEEELEITRGVLENLDKRTDLCVQTKSDLILRDLDLLKRFDRVEAGFTVNSFEGKTKKLFEPFSPGNKRRIRALRALKEEGVKTFSFVSPLIPRLVDIEEVIEKTREVSDYYWFEVINMRGAGKRFREVIREKFPESHRVLKDEDEFSEFVKRCKRIIASEGIKVKGVVTHRRQG